MASLKTCLCLHLHLILSLFLHKTSQESSSGFALKLIPWDSPSSPLYQPNLTQAQKAQTMAIASKARAEHHHRSFTRRRKNSSYNSYDDAMLQIPIKEQGLLYAVTIRIGQPPQKVDLLLDTGSGPIWTKCGPGSRVNFDPARSGHYRTLPCSHPLCRAASSICRCVDAQCICTLKYGLPGTMQEASAVLASDSFTLPARKRGGMVTFYNMIFGCSNQSLIFSGILGMDRLPVSLISQVGNVVQGRYSYCLHRGDSYLRFGNEIPLVGRNFKTVRLIYPNSNHLRLDLLDISVLKRRLRLPPLLFSVENGGFVIDTGSQLTFLNKRAYNRVVRAFEGYYKGRAQRVNGTDYGLELCYRIDSRFRDNPSMTLHFRGADYVVENVFFSPARGVACAALKPGEISLLGALHQFNTRFVFDMYRNTMSFAKENCSQDI